MGALRMTLRANRPHSRALGGALLALGALVFALALGGLSPAGARGRTVECQGKQVEVPRGWPVYRLAQHPGMCVRMDRRAVYLGKPSANQRCPVDAIGRQRAILVDPGAEARARTSAAPLRAPTATASSTYTG